uniref:Uncharacterized protein n=1 Tax=Musca domestica TaxID=7370 RepID=A0A1I8MAT0_MUSDO
MADEGRYSLPSAESTKLNNNTGNSFRWGSSHFSNSRQRCNSSINLVNLDSTVVSKIEPRIFADVQSKGLASRIVKYHENESRLNRSMSTNSLYTKPGQFPIVTLRKTELPFRATKQCVSMTRIVPPVFSGSTLSGLLRSNSVVGLHKSDEDISSENRPIIHPPPTENDMAPTRSVLDVLKEISRKRINSDDSSGSEMTKKNRVGTDLLDSGTNVVNIATPAANFKRQRDSNLQDKVNVNTSFKYVDSNKSPEQIKKRICSYNNDITSSLSSSSKRKSKEIKRPSYQLNQTMPAYLESYETPKLKIPKRNDHSIQDNCANRQSEKNISSISIAQATCGTVPQRSQSEGITPTETYKAVQKPRLTLFNKNYDTNIEKSQDSLENDDNLDEGSECTGIHFVKPKKLTSNSGLKNPILERTQKSKLALMLSGLRGELYDINDEVDTSQKEQASRSSDSIQTSIPKQNNTSAKIDTPESSKSINTQATHKNPSPLVGLKLTPQSIILTQNAKSSKESSVPTIGILPGNNKMVTSNTTATLNNSTATGAIKAAKGVSNTTHQDPFKTSLVGPETKTAATTLLESSNTSKLAENTCKNPSEFIKPSSDTSSSEPFSFGLPSGSKTVPSTSSSSMTNEKFSFNPPLASTSVVQSPVSGGFSFGTALNSNITPPSTTGNQNPPALQATPSTTPNIFTLPNTEAKSSLFGATKATDTTQDAFTSGSKIDEKSQKTDSPKSVGGFSFGIDTSKTSSSGTYTFGNTSSSSAATNKLVSSVTTTVAPNNHNTFPSTSLSEQKLTTVFGNSSSSTSNSAGFAFGSSTTAVELPKISSAFAFGSNNPPPSINQKSAAPPNIGGFSFSAPNNNSTANKPSFDATPPSNTNTLLGGTNNNQSAVNIFGNGGGATSFNFAASPGLSPQTSAGGATNTTFNFGTSSSNNTQTGGTSTGNSSSSTFNFGAVNTKNSQSNITSATSKSLTTTFAFGAASSNPQSSGKSANNATSPAFNFGSSSSFSTSNNSMVKSGMTTNNTSQPAFNFGASVSGSAQSKGTSAIALNNGTKSAFNFSASSSTNNAHSISSPSMSNNITANSGSVNAFRFNNPSASSPQPTGSTTITNNIFAIPQNSSSVSTDRPIRRATRRLQK